MWAKFKALTVALGFFPRSVGALGSSCGRSSVLGALSVGAWRSVERERRGKAYPLPYYFSAGGYAVLLN